MFHQLKYNEFFNILGTYMYIYTCRLGYAGLVHDHG